MISVPCTKGLFFTRHHQTTFAALLKGRDCVSFLDISASCQQGLNDVVPFGVFLRLLSGFISLKVATNPLHLFRQKVRHHTLHKHMPVLMPKPYRNRTNRGVSLVCKILKAMIIGSVNYTGFPYSLQMYPETCDRRTLILHGILVVDDNGSDIFRIRLESLFASINFSSANCLRNIDRKNKTTSELLILIDHATTLGEINWLSLMATRSSMFF